MAPRTKRSASRLTGSPLSRAMSGEAAIFTGPFYSTRWIGRSPTFISQLNCEALSLWNRSGKVVRRMGPFKALRSNCMEGHFHRTILAIYVLGWAKPVFRFGLSMYTSQEACDGENLLDRSLHSIHVRWTRRKRPGQ